MPDREFSPFKDNKILAAIWINLAVACLYFLTGKIGLLLALPPGFATPVWPPSGIAFAALWLMGPRIGFGIFAGSLLLNYQGSNDASIPALTLAASIAAGSTLQTLIAGYFLRRYTDAAHCFKKIQGVLRFSVITLTCCLIASVTGALSLIGLAGIPAADFMTTWLTWWVGDVVGVLIFAPVTVVWLTEFRRAPNFSRWKEIAFFYVLFFSLVGSIFLIPLEPATFRYFLAYLYCPFMIAAAFRQGTRGLTAFLMLGSLSVIVCTLYKLNMPMAHSDLLQLQAFLGVMTLSGLFFLAAVQEKAAALFSLRESEERRNATYRHAAMGICEISLSGDFLDVNPRFCEITGYTREELLSLNFQDITHAEDALRDAQRFRQSQEENNAAYFIEKRCIRKDRSVVWVSLASSLVRNDSGAPLYGIAVIHDITGRKKAEDELVSSQLNLKKAQEELRDINQKLEQTVHERTALADQRAEKLRSLAAALTFAEQTERRRLAQILHDNLQQMLIAARISLNKLKEDSPQAAQAAEKAQELLEEALQASRSLTVELSPPVLRDVGLGAAIDWLLRWMKEKYALNVDFNNDPGLWTASEELKIFLFQAVKELLLNIVKHSGVTHASIHLTSGAKEVRILIEDRGKGFDVTNLSPESSTGFGLFYLQDRLEMLGGKMQLESTRGKGTRIMLSAPAQKAAPQVTEPVLSKKSFGELKKKRATRIVVVDDHKILRQGLKNMLAGNENFEVVGEAEDGEKAIQMAGELLPDIIIMDVGLPKINGIDATQRIKEQYPDIQVIGLSLHESEDVAETMRNAGASAYFCKSDPMDKLIQTIQDVRCRAG